MSTWSGWRHIFNFGLHLLFLASVFDIYFTSPVLQSAAQHGAAFVAPAKRLVLFVADGLRAESLYAHPGRAPFLSKVARDLGAYGVSHTRLPTESRPGHVALIAGMFEDPSAITRGWQENPVDFDTVFNQSNHVWSWGSPDILPMFAKAAWNQQVKVDMYDSSLEKFFANEQISNLDTWVFDKVKSFFKEEADNHLLKRSDKIILFLHLLGLDTNGHANKPHSPEFGANVQVVDQGIQEIVRICEDYWRHDGRTSYIFTSDHGMTDWGSHGAGMEHETQTPFLAWGAGIRSPLEGHSTWPSFSAKKTHDINQTDVAPLMATLIGANMPQHSLGKLPMEYLSIHESHKVEAKVANGLQVHEQYLAFKARCQDSILPRLFTTLDPFTLDLKATLELIDKLKSKANYKAALQLADELYEQSFKGLFHYQRFHRLPLYIATSCSYIGFILLNVLTVLKEFTAVLLPKPNSPVANYLALLGLVYSAVATFGQRVPIHYFLYYVSPFLIWTLVLRSASGFTIAPNQTLDLRGLAKFVILALANLEALILAFFDRRWLAVSISILMVLQLKNQQKRLLSLLWIGLCLGLMAFSFQPSVGKEKMPSLVIMGAFASIALALPFKAKKWTFVVQLLFILTSGLCAAFSSSEMGSYGGIIRPLSWIIFSTSVPLAFTSPPLLLQRLLSLAFGLQAIYQLFCLTYEGLFFVTLTAAMACWLVMEQEKSFAFLALDQIPIQAKPRKRVIIGIDDLQRALAFLTFTIVSFFGTGNIASLNSFDPRSIQTLVTTFSPFLMGSLLLLKVVLPFFLVALFAYAVQYVSQMPQKALFLVVLIFSDFMGLHFFFWVTDQGSWLDIGTSLSHFVIVEATVIFLQLLFQLASFSMKLTLNQAELDKEFVIEHNQ